MNVPTAALVISAASIAALILYVLVMPVVDRLLEQMREQACDRYLDEIRAYESRKEAARRRQRKEQPTSQLSTRRFAALVNGHAANVADTRPDEQENDQ